MPSVVMEPAEKTRPVLVMENSGEVSFATIWALPAVTISPAKLLLLT
jgi:hypothetical protein